MRNAFEALVQNLGMTLGTYNIDITDDCVTFAIDNYLVLVAYLPQGEQVLLATMLASLPPKGNREDLYGALLHGQHFFAQTQGATLSVDNAERGITLQRVDALRGLEMATYPQILERFMQVADIWRKRCARLSGEATSSMEQEPSPPLDIPDGRYLKV